VVSRLAKVLGFRVIANDWEPYARVINRCYVQCNTLPPFAALGGIESAYGMLNETEPVEGWISRHLCPADDSNPDFDTERMFFTRANGMRIDAIRERILEWEIEAVISHEERDALLASLVYSVSYVSNTSGVFKGFHRGWGGKTRTALYRILSDLTLRLPALHDNNRENAVTRMDAPALARQLRRDGASIDIAYLDPPYNQHPYGSNYHVLNTIVLWDRPKISPRITSGNKSAIRTDWRTQRRSLFNHARTAVAAYSELLGEIEARYILTSYSTDGNICLADLLAAASGRGALSCLVKPYKRYRVSSARPSAKPMNAEFVLIIDTAKASSPSDPNRIADLILSAEDTAIAEHPETAALSMR